MDKSQINNILVIGGPNAGKTHFGGQLYGRLNSRKFKYKIDTTNRPADLTIFEDVLNKLSDGLRAGHTESSANRSVELIIHDENENNKIVFAFPDYAGEQVKMIVDNRRINEVWKNYIENSTSWLLFIRLDDVKPLEDIINRGIPTPAEINKRNAIPPPVKVSDSAHFIELLQTIIYVKGVSRFNKINKPNLTIMLSCWDKLKQKKGVLPCDLLKERLPMLLEFIKNNWNENSLSIIGLSSTEKTLTDKPDDDYIDKTPIEFGYLIKSNGEKEKDLTLSINELIGK